jgi:hypothetical protein
MNWREYDSTRDRDAALRIWHECGWIDRTKENQVEAANLVVESDQALVAELRGEAECLC